MHFINIITSTEASVLNDNQFFYIHFDDIGTRILSILCQTSYIKIVYIVESAKVRSDIILYRG